MEQGNKEIVDETQRNELNKDAEWSLRFAKRVWPSRLRQNGQVTLCYTDQSGPHRAHTRGI